MSRKNMNLNPVPAIVNSMHLQEGRTHLKDWEYYQNVDVKFAKKEDYQTWYVYSKGEVIFKGTVDELDKRFPGRSPIRTSIVGHIENKGCVCECITDNDALREQRQKYDEAVAKKEAEFENDLAMEYEVETNPKRAALWSKAWEMGHPSGYSEIANYYGDLVDLIK